MKRWYPVWAMISFGFIFSGIMASLILVPYSQFVSLVVISTLSGGGTILLLLTVVCSPPLVEPFAKVETLKPVVAALGIGRQRLTRNQITTPPFSKLGRFSRFVYSKKTYSRIFEQLIADELEEYFEAVKIGEVWKSRLIRVRGVFVFWSTVVSHATKTMLHIGKVWDRFRGA